MSAITLDLRTFRMAQRAGAVAAATLGGLLALDVPARAPAVGELPIRGPIATAATAPGKSMVDLARDVIERWAKALPPPDPRELALEKKLLQRKEFLGLSSPVQKRIRAELPKGGLTAVVNWSELLDSGFASLPVTRQQAVLRQYSADPSSMILLWKSVAFREGSPAFRNLLLDNLGHASARRLTLSALVLELKPTERLALARRLFSKTPTGAEYPLGEIEAMLEQVGWMSMTRPGRTDEESTALAREAARQVALLRAFARGVSAERFDRMVAAQARQRLDEALRQLGVSTSERAQVRALTRDATLADVNGLTALVSGGFRQLSPVQRELALERLRVLPRQRFAALRALNGLLQGLFIDQKGVFFEHPETVQAAILQNFSAVDLARFVGSPAFRGMPETERVAVLEKLGAERVDIPREAFEDLHVGSLVGRVAGTPQQGAAPEAWRLEDAQRALRYYLKGYPIQGLALDGYTPKLVRSADLYALTRVRTIRDYAFESRRARAEEHQLVVEGRSVVVIEPAEWETPPGHVVSADTVAQAFALVPQEARSHIRTITIEPLGARSDAKHAKRFGSPGFKAAATVDVVSGHVRVYPGQKDPHAVAWDLIHEDGHIATMRAFGGDSKSPAWRNFQARRAMDGIYPSAHGKRTVFEDGADTYLLWIASRYDPDAPLRLAQTFAHTFEAIRPLVEAESRTR